MDKQQFQERVKKLKEINKVIESLDPSIKEAGFKLLQSYATGKEKESTNGGDDESLTNKEKFFTKFSHDQPADNVFLITAYFYSQYGTSPISIKEIKEVADDVGLTIPNRPDMTLKNAQRDGKSLFTSKTRGSWNPTVHGEKFLKEEYEVRKGRKKKVEE